MELRTFATVVLAGALLTGGAVYAPAQDTTKTDNTKTNKQDRNSNNPTADNQKNNKSDRELTREIRRSITSDKSLSTYAHNVKIVSQSGSVTLRGPVRSEDEKKTIEQKAAEVAGAANVKNEITIVSADPSGKKPSTTDSDKK